MDETLRADSTLPARLLVLPHRSLTRAGLWLFLAVQGVATGGFAGLAAWRGNVFAPYFAVLDWCAVACVLSLVWRRGGAGEAVTLSASELEITRLDDSAPPIRFHPYWVRLELRPGRHFGWASRLLLCSHGREVEVGRFLNEAERGKLACRLSELLRQARAGGMEGGDGRD